MSLTVIDSSNIFQKDVIGKVRTAQEDSHDIAALTPNGDVFVVCDGMGGHVGGKQASSIAVKCIIEYLKKERYANPLKALDEALQFANMQILGYAQEHPELKGMGTTACVLLLQEDEAYIAHVGDSRIYLYLANKRKLHRLTKDHSYVQLLVDGGQITEEEAEHHPNKNRILKALGVNPKLEPTVSSVKPKNGDIFLICSDGLNGMIPDTVIRDILGQNESLDKKGETLIDRALEAGGYDNITVELIHISNSPHISNHLENSLSVDKRPMRIPTKIKRIILPILIFVVCVVLGICIYKFSQRNSNNYNTEISTNDVESIEEKMDRLQNEIDSLENRRKYFDNLIKASGYSDIEGLREEYEKSFNTIEDEITAKRDTLKNLETINAIINKKIGAIINKKIDAIINKNR